MFLTPERTVINRIGDVIRQQVADAELQLAQLPTDDPEHDQVNLRLGELRRATHRIHHLMRKLSERAPATSSPHFVIGFRGIAQNMQ